MRKNYFKLSILLICIFSTWHTKIYSQAQTIGSFPAMQGGFESYSTGALGTATSTSTWFQNSGGNLATITTNTSSVTGGTGTARTGTKFISIPAQTGTGKYPVCPNTLSLTASTSYVVQFFYRTLTGSTYVVANYSDKNTGNVTLSTNTSWTKSYGTFTTGATPSAALSVGFKLNSSTLPLTEFDDIVCYPGSTLDITAPSDPTSQSTTANNGSVTLNWTGSQYAGDGGGYVIVQSTSATSVTLNSNGIYGVGNTTASGSGTIKVITAGVSGTAQSATITGLTNGTTYYYTIFACDKAFNYSNGVTCNATPSTGTPPTVTTTSITSIGTSTATSGGEVTSEGSTSVTAKGVCWNTSGTPTTSDSKTTDGTGSGSYNSSLTSLIAGTHYYIRAYATNNAGTSYGSEVEFTTASATPDINMSSSDPAISSSLIGPNTSKNIIYKFSLSVSTANSVLNQIDFTTGGTYTETDITKFQLWYSTTDNLASASQIGSDIASSLGIGSHSFTSLSQAINAGSTGYLWITTNIANAATLSNTINVEALLSSNITFTSANLTGTTYAGNAQTIAVLTSPTDYFQSKATGDWSSLSTWQSSTNGTDSWIDATLIPTSTAALVTINGNKTVTITTATNLPSLTISGGSKLIASADVSRGASKTIHVYGTYQHNINGDTIPTATWHSYSTIYITGVTSTLPVAIDVDFYHFSWNCPNQSATLGGIWNDGRHIKGNVTISSTGSTGSNYLRFMSMAAGTTKTITIDGNLSLNGGFVTSNGSSASGTADIVVKGDFSIGTGCTFMTNKGSGGSTCILDLYGDFTVNTGGTLSSNTVTDAININFKKSGTQTYTNTGTINPSLSAITFNITNGSTLDLGTSLIGGTTNFNVASGGGLKTANSNGVDGNLTTTGTINLSNNSNYEFNGSTAQTISSLLPGTLNSLTINNTGGVTLASALTSATNLTISSGASISVPAGKQLTVSGTLSNSGTINLNSDAAGTATILTPAGSAGTASVQQYLPQGRNWYISSPVLAADASAISGANLGSSVVYYDEANSAWTPTTGSLTPGLGYISVATAGSATSNAVFNGTLNNGDISVILTRQGTSKAGFNLVANPYASYMDGMAAVSANANLEQTIWYRTKISGTYYFETVNTASGVGSSPVEGSVVSRLIPPMQAFWVRTLTDNNTLTFTNAMRYHANPTISGSTVSTTVMKAPKQTNNQLIRLRVSNGVNSDETVIYSNANASNGYDIYDSQKMLNNSNTIPDLYTTCADNKLVINGMNTIPLETEIPIGFTPGSAGAFSFSASELTNFDSSVELYLKDAIDNSYNKLAIGDSYNFSSDNTTSTSRFSLILKTKSVTTDLNNQNNTKIMVNGNGSQQLIVKCPDNQIEKSKISIFNAIGQLIKQQILSCTNTQISLPAGVYTVNAGGIISKVIIK